MKLNKFLSILALAGALSSSCSDQLEVQPTGDISVGSLFQTVEGAEVALNGIYRNMYVTQTSRHDSFGEMAIKLSLDLRGDDFYNMTIGYGWFNNDYRWNDYKETDGRTAFVWSYYYENIANANVLIANIDGVSGTEDEKSIVKAQALALRAYFYFNLVQMYQHTYVGNETALGVPLYLEPSTPDTPPLARATVQEVYDQILADLSSAEGLFEQVNYSQEHSSFIDANIVNGLTARVALVMNDWSKAADYASKARAGVPLASSGAYAEGFSVADRGNGWLWGLQVIGDQSTIYASYFSHIDNTAYGYAGLGMQKCINKQLFDRLNATDVRKQYILDPANVDPTNGFAAYPYMNYKYRMATPSTWAADYVLMRAEEMVLIEAEAQAMLGQDSDAATTLQELVSVRDLTHDVTALTGAALQDEISFQRRVELWGEGHRLFDLLRKKERLDRTNGGHNPGFALVMEKEVNEDGWILEIPRAEMDANPNMVQN